SAPGRPPASARAGSVARIRDGSGSAPGPSGAVLVRATAAPRHKIISLNSAVAERLSNEACTATSIHYAFNTQATAGAVGSALVARGDDSWFFITVDYSFGYDLERDATAVVEQHGGKGRGRAGHPVGAR